MHSDAAEVEAPVQRIVGIGASAGGLESLRQVLLGLPEDAGPTYVVLQHLAPTHRSLLSEILAQSCSMPVREIRDGDRPQPNEVLVTPANAHIEFDGECFRLTTPGPQSLPRPSINLFFLSLAAVRGRHCGGIILSGTGSDGAQGMQEIQAAGGLVLVQSNESARYTGMPDAASRAVGIGHMMAPQDMGDAVRAWADQSAPPGPCERPSPAGTAGAGGGTGQGDDDADLPVASPSLDEMGGSVQMLQDLIARVRRHCGVNLGDYKEGTLLRRIARRVVACGAGNLSEYLAHVQEEPAELGLLARETLISVTSFWRDAAAFACLRDHIGQYVHQERREGLPLRVWVAGCATGEEAYSVAMLWMEALGDRLTDDALQVFATDLDLEAMQFARRGVYSAESLAALPQALRERYFTPMGAQFEVSKHLRERIVFSRHDLTRDPPFPRVDMVSCRNVMIYLKPEAQDRVMRAFHYALHPQGLMFLGQSESVLNHFSLFQPVDKETRLYQRLPGRAPMQLQASFDRSAVVPAAPAAPLAALVPLALAPAPRGGGEGFELELLRQGATAFLPPSVLLDQQLRVLQLHGDLSPFLALRAGPQSFDLLALARPEIASELRLLCSLGGADTQAARQARVVTQEGRRRKRWQVRWQPFVSSRQQPMVLLSFVELAARRRSPPQAQDAAAIGRPDAELEEARERTRSLIEQLEAFNEEMQALNEEAQSSNEELQASNEEMESANEELQATNQELATVNAELNHQWRRYQRLAEELQSIHNSINMPMLVLDAKQCIRRYNDSAARLFRLSPGCEGFHLATMFRPAGIPDLLPLVQQASDSASPQVVNLPPTQDGHEYVLHLNHNVSGGERCGLVLTMVDNTDLARAEQQTRDMEQRMLSVLTHGRAMVAIKDSLGRYEFVNPMYAAFFGLDREQMLGRTDAQLLPVEIAAQLGLHDVELLGGDTTTEREEMFDLAGQRRAWWATRFGLRDAHGGSEGLCIQAVDLTSSLDADEALRIAARVFDITNEGILIVGAEGRVQRVNAAFLRLCGLQESQIAGQHPGVFDHQRNGRDFLAGLLRSTAETGSWQGEAWVKRGDGSTLPCWLSVSGLRNAEGALTHHVMVLTDISALADAREHMRRLATHDALTGLPNRDLLLDRLTHAIGTARRHGTELALCFIDLDNFKNINDSLGHEVGDDVLKLTAQQISECVRSADTLARLGGDEFVLLLEATSRHECLQSVERITRVLAVGQEVGGNLVSTTASIGIAMFPGDGADTSTLMRLADTAMYRAKRAGRSRYEFYSEEVGLSARHRMQIESGLRQALGRDQLRLHYQPQVDPISGRVHAVEALLRWPTANGEQIAPAMFLPIAEESSLIESLGAWVVNSACRQLAHWRRSGWTGLRMAINVSPRQLRDRQFASCLQQAMMHHAVPGDRIVLEITESALLQQSDVLTQLLRQLDALGVELSLDDFGTGYSSLSHLKQVPLDELKIDRSFVCGVLDQRDDREIVDAIIGLGLALGLRIVAEGVESGTQLDHFRREGVNLLVQGYHVAKPMSAEDLDVWLAGHHPVAETV